MSADGLGGMFGALFGGMFPGMGSYPEPPDSLVLRILGLHRKPLTQDQVKSAFRARLMQIHPDLNPGTYAAVPALQDAAEALAMQRPEVAELVWARDVLLRKVPVTAADGARGSFVSRNGYRPLPCKSCGREITGLCGKPEPLPATSMQRWRGYCAPCANAAELERLRELRRERRRRTCATCGEMFTPPRSDGRYCSPACRQKAYRQRSAGLVSTAA